MIVKEVGRYRLLSSIYTRNATTIAIIPAGTILSIHQVDREYHKVLGTELLDWTYWDLPVEKANK